MASLQKKGDGWYCQFLYHGKRHTFTVGKVSEDEAKAKAAQAMRVKQQLVTVPPGIDICTFLQFDGKVPETPIPKQGPLTLAGLRDRYLQTHSNGVLEKTTTYGIEIQFRHLGQQVEGLSHFRDKSYADELPVHIEDFENSTFGDIICRKPLHPQVLRKFKRFHGDVDGFVPSSVATLDFKPEPGVGLGVDLFEEPQVQQLALEPHDFRVPLLESFVVLR